MNSDQTTVVTAPFGQLVAVEQKNATNDFDVIIAPPIELGKYCGALIDKIFLCEQSRLFDFIAYQLEQVNDPIGWLDSLDLLITRNEPLFVGNNLLFKYQKLFNILDRHRDLLQCPVILKPTKPSIPKRLINAESEERYFSFHETKIHIESLNSFCDKIIYLTEEIFEYRGADIISKNNKLQDYDFQCNQLIEKLQTLRKMRIKFEKEQTQNGNNFRRPEPIQLNGAINILTNVFKQMMVNVKPDGKTPYLNCRIKEVSQFICDNFVDENGHPLSQSTIQTYLSPNRIDKNPNNDYYIKV